ncbi:unnamed protein product, partial [Rangifer tarandus platyrhynchus]
DSGQASPDTVTALHGHTGYQQSQGRTASCLCHSLHPDRGPTAVPAPPTHCSAWLLGLGDPGGRCLATSATKTHTEEEKAHGRWGWVFLGKQRGLGHSMLDPFPTGFSSFLLSMQLSPPGCLPLRGSQGTKLRLVMGELDAREPETLQQVSALFPLLLSHIPYLSGEKAGAGATVPPR